MPNATLQDILAEEARRTGKPVEENWRSVLDTEEKPTSTFKALQDFVETSAKGGARGALDLLTLWPEVVRQIKGEEDTPFTADYITSKVKEATGVDIMSIPGSSGLFQFSRAALPAIAMKGMGMGNLGPGASLMGSASRYALEGGLAGGTSIAAEQMAPDSPIAQFLIQAAPSVAIGGFKKAQDLARQPVGEMRPEVTPLQEVGPLTPGEAAGSRIQMAREGQLEGLPSAEASAEKFRSRQAQATRNYVEKVFDSASARVKPDVTKIYSGITNYGKALVGKLKKDAGDDFSAAEGIPSLIDASPVVTRLKELKASISPDAPDSVHMANAIDSILNRLTTPEVPAVRTPSKILSAEGAPAFVDVTPGRPEGITKMTISDLKQAMSSWGDTAYSGKHSLLGVEVAPGQAKGLARAILTGYHDALGNAIDAKIPGADLLKKARTNFKQNLDNIETFENTKIVKTFGKPLNELPVEEVLKKLETIEPSQRNLLIKFVRDDYPEVENTLRRVKFNKLLDDATIRGAPEGAPTFDVKIALKKLDEMKEEWNWLLPNKESRAKANQAINYLRVVTSKAKGMEQLAVPAYGAVAAIGGNRQAAWMAQGLELIRRNIVSPQSIADIVFNPETVDKLLALQSRSTPRAIYDFSVSLGKSTAKTGVRASFGSGVDKPYGQGASQPLATEEQIDEEMRRRGLLPQ